MLVSAILLAVGSHASGNPLLGRNRVRPAGFLANQPASVVAEETPQTATDAACIEEAECGNCFDLAFCNPPGRFWMRADYLMWWTNGANLPPLVTNGILGDAGTQVLFGDSTVANDGRSGFRTTLGMWLDHCQNWGVEFDYLNLGSRSAGYSADSLGNAALARPIYNVLLNAQDCQYLAYPQLIEGAVNVSFQDYFQSAGVALNYNLCSNNACSSGDDCEEDCALPLLFGRRTDLIVGLRYYNLSDRLGVQTTRRFFGSGLTDAVEDSFRASNDFYGSELGLRTRMYRGRWSLEVLTKIAIGNTHQTTTIAGQTVTTPVTGASQSYDAGFLATGSNSGTYHHDVFTMIPQIGLELGYQVNCHWRAFVGYNLLYWGCVQRAADQIDRNVDLRNDPTSGYYDPTSAGPFPSFPNRTASFWAQGVNVGTEFRF